MKSKWSILTPLFLSAFAAMFIAILSNLSDNLDTLLEITNISQEDFEQSDRGTEDEAGTRGAKEVGGHLFRGKIPEMITLKKIQNQIDQSEANLPPSRIQLEKSATDEIQNPPDRNQKARNQKISPGIIDRTEKYVFCVHYASHKHLPDAKMEVTNLSEKGFLAHWVKTDVPGKGEWSRVYIGKEKTRQEAMDLAVKLKEAGMIREIYVHKMKAE